VLWLDRDHFDRREVNRRLKQYAQGDSKWSHSFC
jgi:hypothetical protein